MKPRNREINIFNLSMLDVISGAMGAFLIVMVILLPYYKKETIDYQKELQQSRASEDACYVRHSVRHMPSNCPADGEAETRTAA